MNIAVVGTGYVGLVSGVCFAETGNNVICVDIDAKKVERLRKGEVVIYEPGLEPLFERNARQGRLKFTTDLAEGIKDAEIIFLALPTPPGEDGSADLKYILGVAADLSKIITDYKVIVDKSTVPVGTSEKVHAILADNLDESLFDVVSNPEFLREGVAVDDFLKPDRVVIGTSSDRAAKVMKRLYDPFVRQGNPVIVMDERSAEMTKYAANSYLATRITFMNEIANLCELAGADVDSVRRGFDPEAMENVAKEKPEVTMVEDQYEALDGADALAICTEWKVFRTPSFPAVKKMLAQPLIFDGRNLYDLDAPKEHGFTYYSACKRSVICFFMELGFTPYRLYSKLVKLFHLGN